MASHLHRRALLIAAPTLLAAVLLATGCHHKTYVAAYQPPPPAPIHRTPPPSYATNREPTPRPEPIEPPSVKGRPTLVETGMASWYGTNYNHRKGADGNIYDENALTAAHRTLPLGTMVRVTNLATDQTVVVKITDRGPFVKGRVLDLSVGAAKAVGLYRMGVAKVRIEAYQPQQASATGIWCVQTGAFATEGDAMDLKNALLKRYRTAKVQEFQGPTGYWVRIDPAGRTHTDALAIQDWIGKPDDHADAYLVRLD